MESLETIARGADMVERKERRDYRILLLFSPLRILENVGKAAMCIYNGLRYVPRYESADSHLEKEHRLNEGGKM